MGDIHPQVPDDRVIGPPIPVTGPRTRMYRVAVLVADGKPGYIPFTWHLNAHDRDDAIRIVRERTRMQGRRVKKVLKAYRLTINGDGTVSPHPNINRRYLH